MKSSTLFPSLAAIVLCGAMLAPLAAPRAVHSQDAPPHLSGRFEYIGGDRDRQRLEAAIVRSTAGMFFLVQTIAADKMRGENPVYAYVDVRPEPSSVRVDYGGTVIATRDGAEVDVRSHGNEPLRARHVWQGADLEQIFVHQGGAGTRTNYLAAEGAMLELSVNMESGQLSAPIRYRLRYRRLTATPAP